MSEGDFKADWVRHFRKVPPLGYVLRERFHSRWVRFHALPKSKRYADCQIEHFCILRRFERLGSSLFGDGQRLWLVTCKLKATGEVEGALKVAGVTRALPFQFAVRQEDFNDTLVDLQVFALETNWKSNAFELLVGEIAADRMNAIWFDPITGRVFAPYDGGFDLILESRFRAVSLAWRFRLWMSEREDML